MERSIKPTPPRPPLMRHDLEQSLMRRSINPLSLSPFQRILLTTDGTVTEMLEAFAGESIRVVKLFQEVTLLDRAVSSLELPWGQHVLRRTILLQGRMSLMNLLYAESILALDRLDAGVREGLLQSKKPIGTLVLEHRIETFKEILDCGREPAGAVAQYFGIEEQASLIFRTYRMVNGGRPIMVITEKFPEAYFREWNPTGVVATPTVGEVSHAPAVADEQDCERILHALEAFVRDQRPADGAPVGPDTPLLESGLLDGAGFFALLAFVGERFGVKFDDDELVPDRFRTLALVARRVAERRGGRHG